MNKQAKKGSGLIFIAIIIGTGLILYFSGTLNNLFSVSGNERMTRSVVSTANPNGQITLTYTATGTSGAWFASIVDSLSGGCTFPNGATNYQAVLTSSSGNTKTVTINTPNSGTCTFSGNYQFGSSSIINFDNNPVQICTLTCSRPSDLCVLASSTSNGCGGTCEGTWIVNKNSFADANCDNTVSDIEFNNVIAGWLSGSKSRSDLNVAGMAWIGGN